MALRHRLDHAETQPKASCVGTARLRQADERLQRPVEQMWRDTGSRVVHEDLDTLAFVHMPRLDGLAATRLIRSWENDAGRTPIIAVTANAAPDEIAACREAGMDAVVGKPISAAALLSAISDQVDC